MILELQKEYTVVDLCDTLGVSKSGFYKNISREPSKRELENKAIIEAIKAIRKEPYKSEYGSPRMTQELRKHGFHLSENRVARIMAEENMNATPKAAFRPKTTIQDSKASASPNLLKDTTPSNPGEVLISDITYVATREGWLYLAVVIDLFTREVIGWKLDDNMKASLVVQALDQAATHTQLSSETVFHSDRGSQYSSKKVRKWLGLRKMKQSMSALGYCYDNAACESFFSTLKRESFPDRCVFDTKTEARMEIFKYIETFYNRERIHTSLGDLSPIKFHKNHLKNQKKNIASVA